MAKNDIRPWRPSAGGTQNMVAYPLDANETFEDGEVVVVNASGLLEEAGSDPAVVTGISAASSQGKTATGAVGPRPTGSLIQVYTPTDEQLFICENFAIDGAGTTATPAQSSVGDTAGFILTGGNWFVDTGAGNAHIEVVAVLDANGQPVGDTTVRTAGAGTQVVFVFV